LNPINPINITPPLPHVSAQPGTFCTGALRLQRNATLTIHDIVRNNPLSPTDTRLICRHCNLQIGDSRDRQIVYSATEKQTEIARSHILAFASLIDRKAMFRCRVCCLDEIDAEFREMKELIAHLRERHGMPWMEEATWKEKVLSAI
jgi:hypothetical protein